MAGTRFKSYRLGFMLLAALEIERASSIAIGPLTSEEEAFPFDAEAERVKEVGGVFPSGCCEVDGVLQLTGDYEVGIVPAVYKGIWYVYLAVQYAEAECEGEDENEEEGKDSGEMSEHIPLLSAKDEQHLLHVESLPISKTWTSIHYACQTYLLTATFLSYILSYQARGRQAWNPILTGLLRANQNQFIPLTPSDIASMKI